MLTNTLLGFVMLGGSRPLIFPAILFLFIIWLIYRVEGQVAKKAKDEIFHNFPFFKSTADSFQQRLDYLNLRIEELEKRINKLEKIG